MAIVSKSQSKITSAVSRLELTIDRHVTGGVSDTPPAAIAHAEASDEQEESLHPDLRWISDLCIPNNKTEGGDA